jgi:hypothetical protein
VTPARVPRRHRTWQAAAEQGYSSAMLIHESRILRVTIFGTLHESLSLLDFNPLLPDVMTIADEVDSQLTQTMESFTNGSSKSAKAQLVKRGDEFRLKTCF